MAAIKVRGTRLNRWISFPANMSDDLPKLKVCQMLDHMLDYRKRSQSKLKKGTRQLQPPGYPSLQKAGLSVTLFSQNAEGSQYANHNELTFLEHDYRLLLEVL